MADQDTTGARPRPRGTEKRRAIMRGALRVFAREGYTRASIDAIAREAEVSTRTIYNHFQDKAELFQTVIQDSAEQVADAQIATIAAHLDAITDLERDLVAFGRVWATPMPDYVDHFALVRQIQAEVGHIPPAAFDAWQQAGPLRVGSELTRRMRELGDRGLLRIDDAERAASHFTLLAATEVANRSYFGSLPLATDEITRIATAGVHAFLCAYGPT